MQIFNEEVGRRIRLKRVTGSAKILSRNNILGVRGDSGFDKHHHRLSPTAAEMRLDGGNASSLFTLSCNFSASSFSMSKFCRSTDASSKLSSSRRSNMFL